MDSGRYVTVIQHEQVEGLGTIAESLTGAGFAARYVRAHAGDAIPREPGDARGLIVMGGPMGVYDAARYPFLRDEMRLIEQTLASGRPVLGICLGSQLLAQVLGAEVRASGRKEIGWHEARVSPGAAADPLFLGTPSAFMGFHWHGDIFPLPAGATLLASSASTPHQAFRHGLAYGLLFHLEVTEDIVRDMVQTWPEELAEERLDGAAIVRGCAKHLAGMQAIARVVFGRFTKIL